MTNQNNNPSNTTQAQGGVRPMKVVVDEHGHEWLCDKNVDSDSSYASQGCWRTDQMAFDRNF